ncbi:hypothetical protein DL764_009565 [Monosporascus ibericus]|uniref:Uncharacterized protein n=1 Tax=Monosporascus ibericus TaxID=155417 RepID=A0A4Q4SXI9_9PEZI|nr:hypothetical protein DL764_009565 [Monosporascus ibericus]
MLALFQFYKAVSWDKRMLMAPDLATSSSRASSAHEPRLVSPVTRPGSSSSNGVNSTVGRTCQYGGCPSTVLSGGQYCMRHKKSESPVRSTAASKSTLHRPMHDNASKPHAQFAQPRKINGHPQQTIIEGKSGDAITVNATTQPVRPANSKKQLLGKVARKSTGPARFDPRHAHNPETQRTFPPKIIPSHTPNTNGAFSDSRPTKKPRLSPVNGEGIVGLSLASTELQKANGTDGEEFSLRPKLSADSKASKAGQPDVARKGPNPQKQTTEEKPSGRDERPASQKTKNNYHVVENGDRGSTAAELQRPHAHAHEDKDPRRSKVSPIRSQPRRDRIEVQLMSKQTSSRHNKEQSVAKEKPDLAQHKSDFPQEPSHYSRGPRPPESDLGRGESHEQNQNAPVSSGPPEVPRDNGFVALNKTNIADESRKRGETILNPEERRRILVERHDPEKFDSYIYGKANEPFRPGSVLFNVPWYEQPARPVRPATSFGYFDPRVHWTEPKPPQWYGRKRKEVSERGGRKANFGLGPVSAARRKREDQRADRWVILPERVVNNPKWRAALEELDEMGQANRLRSLGLLGSRTTTTTSSGQNSHKTKPKRRRKREKRPEEQELETVEAPQAPRAEEQQQGEGEEERGQAEAEAEAEAEEEEEGSPAKARQQRRRRKKGRARATLITDDEDDWAGGDGDDEYMEVDSD